MKSVDVELLRTPTEVVAALVRAAEAREPVTIAGVEYVPATSELTVPEIQRLWLAIAGARLYGWSKRSGDDEYARSAEAKLQARFEQLTG